ncbi:HotDog domain-containing protein [Spinellus fusiger]|nr:HotDog domain-containing protein [Spinellus fusiger]
MGIEQQEFDSNHELIHADKQQDSALTSAKAYLDAMSLVKEYRSNEEMIEIEAYSHFKDSAKACSLTATTLRGIGKIVIAPIMFFNKAMTQVTVICHLGKNLCGHRGIIHGGLLATLLDEVLGCVAYSSMPSKTGFTANLNVDYRKPVLADQWVVLRGELERSEGRKAYTKAWVESEEGVVYVEAKALYISPKVPNTATNTFIPESFHSSDTVDSAKDETIPTLG